MYMNLNVSIFNHHTKIETSVFVFVLQLRRFKLSIYGFFFKKLHNKSIIKFDFHLLSLKLSRVGNLQKLMVTAKIVFSSLKQNKI